ncbi:MAG: helix-turn-helix domain-containing protein [Tannerella sp.]|jgi:transcriptional regulator with XRE-family HTH domain|nr:helix-turn-helix domain-containing protein [Tannerella sp.]
MKDRIIQLMETEGFSPSKFADEIGIQRAVISHITTGRNEPSKDVIIKILERFPDISPDWLLLGKDDMRRTKIGEVPRTATKGLPDLFANPTQIRLEEKKVTENRPETEAKRPVETVQQTVKEFITVKETPARKVLRIMVFYSDNTYETFVSEK